MNLFFVFVRHKRGKKNQSIGECIEDYRRMSKERFTSGGIIGGNVDADDMGESGEWWRI